MIETNLLWQFDIILLSMLVVCAVSALTVKDLVAASIILGAYGFLICLVYITMMAVDVAFTEAAVGAGVSTVLLLGTANLIKRRSRD